MCQPEVDFENSSVSLQNEVGKTHVLLVLKSNFGLHALNLKFGKGFANDWMRGECLRLFPLKHVNTDLWSERSFHILLPEKSNICCRFTGDGREFLAMASPSKRPLWR